jgi:anthranilate phosphoribosyltransferase
MSPSPIQHAIQRVLAGNKPTAEELEAALHPILRGEASDVEIAGLLVALATQSVDGPTLAAAARVLRLHRVAVHPEVRPLIDTCGTGGDGAGTFNISTASAFVVAAAGAAVAKHGNRGVSSKVGSADVLESLGCKLELVSGAAQELLDAIGFVFMFAPSFHPAMRHVGPVRKALGVRTLFNLLGPLSNPALAEYQVLGVFAQGYTLPMAEALRELGSEGALVVHCEGMDEIGLHGVTRGHRLFEGEIRSFELKPEDLGLERTPLDRLAGGDNERNAVLLREAIAGKAGPCADVVALNAGAALFVAGMAESIEAGFVKARELMRAGKAERVLARYVKSSTRMAKVAV